jgi:hypothetical protein
MKALLIGSVIALTAGLLYGGAVERQVKATPDLPASGLLLPSAAQASERSPGQVVAEAGWSTPPLLVRLGGKWVTPRERATALAAAAEASAATTAAADQTAIADGDQTPPRMRPTLASFEDQAQSDVVYSSPGDPAPSEPNPPRPVRQQQPSVIASLTN